MKIVVNRVGYDTGQISLKKAQETIGREIFWQIPNDYRVMVEVRNNGVPLIQQAPKAAITQSIGQLADALCGKHDEPQRRRHARVRSWLNLWPARSGAYGPPFGGPVASRDVGRKPTLRLSDRHNRADRLVRLILDRPSPPRRLLADRGELSFLGAHSPSQ